MTYVWIVYAIADTNVVLSVHSGMELAYEARAAYIEDGQYGRTTDDFWVAALRLDQQAPLDNTGETK